MTVFTMRCGGSETDYTVQLLSLLMSPLERQNENTTVMKPAGVPAGTEPCHCSNAATTLSFILVNVTQQL